MPIYLCLKIFLVQCKSSNVNAAPLTTVFSFPAEREEMISCVYVSRDEERVTVAFSRPVNVSVFFLM